MKGQPGMANQEIQAILGTRQRTKTNNTIKHDAYLVWLMSYHIKCTYNFVFAVCDLPSDSGPCYSQYKMYFYNSYSKKCEQFSYGGCYGNDNRFLSKAECESTCGSYGPPAQTGKCFVFFLNKSKMYRAEANC